MGGWHGMEECHKYVLVALVLSVINVLSLLSSYGILK